MLIWFLVSCIKKKTDEKFVWFCFFSLIEWLLFASVKQVNLLKESVSLSDSRDKRSNSDIRSSGTVLKTVGTRIFQKIGVQIIDFWARSLSERFKERLSCCCCYDCSREKKHKLSWQKGSRKLFVYFSATIWLLPTIPMFRRAWIRSPKSEWETMRRDGSFVSTHSRYRDNTVDHYWWC